MLTSVRSASSLERVTSERCPWCSAPIVGTRPTLSPSARHAATCDLSVRNRAQDQHQPSSLRRSSSRSARLEAREFLGRHRRRCGRLRGTCRRGRRRRSSRSALSIVSDSAAYAFTNFGTCPVVSPSRSCQTRTWPSQPAPAPMPIVGIGQGRGDPFRHLRRDGFEHDGEAAGALERACRLVDRQRLGRRSSARAIAAQLGDRLRREAHVPHHRECRRARMARIRRRVRPAPSTFTASAPPSFTRRTALSTACSSLGLVGAKRHVGHDQRMTRRPRDGARSSSPSRPS